jgi:hypothetical protein
MLNNRLTDMLQITSLVAIVIVAACLIAQMGRISLVRRLAFHLRS